MLTEYLNPLMEMLQPYCEGWDNSVLCAAAAVVVLVAVWIFARLLRLLAVVLLAFCVAFLVLKLGFDIDLLNYLPAL